MSTRTIVSAWILMPLVMYGIQTNTGGQLLGSVEADAAVTNIASGKPYTLSPKPNYRHCTDPGDNVQLTDGKLAEGYFWTQKGTVGWQRAGRVVITVDLGQVLPVAGVSFRTAAGTAGVQWPQIVLIMVSKDGSTYYYAGELLGLSARKSMPAADGYAVHTYHTDELKTCGRFVRVVAVANGPYLFCDEIQVYRGDNAYLNMPPGEPVRDLNAILSEEKSRFCLRRRLQSDLHAIKTRIAHANITQEHRQLLGRRAEGLGSRIEQACNEQAVGSRAVMPLNDWHRQLIGIQGELWRLQGFPPLAAWPVNQWDMMDFWGDPRETSTGTIDIEMMRNEVRSAAFNVATSGGDQLRISLEFRGGHRHTLANAVRFHKVEWTGTKQGTVVATALVPLEDNARITLVPGMITQVWLRIDSSTLMPGRWEGRILVETESEAKASIGIRITVHPLTFPQRPTLHVGGWDYTDADRSRGVTPQNRLALVKHLQERFVDVPWAQSATMPAGKYDNQGNMVAEPSAERFDAWVKLWPDARIYAVFLSVGDTFGGSRIGTQLFERKLATWTAWWADRLKRKGIDPGKLAILLVDEPRNRELDLRVTAWAKVIESVAPEIIIWEDPCHIIWKQGAYDPRTRQQMFDMCDVLCAQRPRYLTVEEYRKLFDDLKEGQELWFYSCSGPVRMLDPYSYYRLQAWQCWQAGAKGTHFWAFGAAGGWNEYTQPGGTWNPLILDTDSVTPGKQMEAIAESVEDYEYLHMLRQAIERARASGHREQAAHQAEKLLAEAADRVLNAPGASGLWWKDKKDRSLADAVRVEVLRALVRLAGK